jgi:tetratricopeptide (TPR) repeat protein
MKKNKSSHLLQQQKQIKPQAASTVALELQHAVWLHQQGQLAHAETVYRQILRTEPRHFDALHFLGILTLQAGNAQNAIELIGRAIEINPDQAAAHSNISNALRVLHRHQEALASCERALRLAPDYAEAHNNR